MAILCAVCTHVKAPVRQVSFGESRGTAGCWYCNSETVDKSVDRMELLIKWIWIGEGGGVINPIIIIVIVIKICIKFKIRWVIGVV
jgi:hypothetical protein